MKTALTINSTKFITAVKAVQALGGKPMADILNRNVLKVAIGSGGGKGLVQLTPKAKEAKIRQDMRTPVTAVQSRDGSSSGSHTIPRVIALAAIALKERGVRKKGFIDPAYNAQVSALATRITAARVQSRAYIAAGWLWAARDLASQTPGTEGLTRLRQSNMPTKGNGHAAMSFAVAAESTRLYAGLYNTSNGAQLFTEAIPQAVANATNDMRTYILTKLGKQIALACA